MKIVIKYHNKRMLLTVDLNCLVDAILQEYSDDVILEFVAMTEEEHSATLDERDGICAVRERFWIIEHSGEGIRRRDDLEDAVVYMGQR